MNENSSREKNANKGNVSNDGGDIHSPAVSLLSEEISRGENEVFFGIFTFG